MPDPAEKITTALAQAVATRTVAWNEGCYYWGDAIAYDGLLAVDTHLDAGFADILTRRLARWYEDAPDSWDDALAPGAAVAALVQRGALEEGALERVVTAVTRLPRTDGVPLLRPHVPGWRTLVWVDSIYHLPVSLVSAGRLFERPDLVHEGVEVAGALVRLLTSGDAVGHAYDTGLRRGTGIRWTRGIGWALLGLLDVLALVPDAGELATHADRLLGALVSQQRADGHWPTVLDQHAADDETSVAGFFVTAANHAALAPAHRAELLDASDRALDALLRSIDTDGTVLGVSHDTHVTWSVDDYLHPTTLPSPWGQGAALRALATGLAAGRREASA